MAAGCSGHSNGDQSHLPCAEDRLDYTLRIPGRADSDGDIAGSAERLKLAREYVLVPIIIGDGGQSGCIHMKSDRWQWIPLPKIAAHELRGEMLSIGGAAAISKKEGFVARAKR